MSPEEDALLDSMVRLSGMTKQDYIIARLLKFEITVQGNDMYPVFWTPVQN